LDGRGFAGKGGVESTFTQKFILMFIAGFFAACFFWIFCHIVNEAIYECREGWQDSLHGKTWVDAYLQDDDVGGGEGYETANAQE
jgi:hypothetical protein